VLVEKDSTDAIRFAHQHPTRAILFNSRYLILRFIRLLLAIACLWIVLEGSIGLSQANDVPLPLDQLNYSWNNYPLELLAGNFLITVIIEYLVIWVFLGWSEKVGKELVGWVLFVNAITNPASQVAAVFFANLYGSDNSSAWIAICAIELIAATVEFGIMTLLFRRMHRNKIIDKPVPTKRTILIVLTANVASFLFGFIGLLFLLIEANPYYAH
jgi:hypothetical protein